MDIVVAAMLQTTVLAFVGAIITFYALIALSALLWTAGEFLYGRIRAASTATPNRTTSRVLRPAMPSPSMTVGTIRSRRYTTV